MLLKIELSSECDIGWWQCRLSRERAVTEAGMSAQ